jgi:hypothetical protein
MAGHIFPMELLSRARASEIKSQRLLPLAMLLERIATGTTLPANDAFCGDPDRPRPADRFR